jgi:hypothetical protein
MVAAVALITGEFVYQMVAGRHAFFYVDDYLYLQEAQQAPRLTIEFLRVNSYGHFAPITRTAYFVVQHAFGLDYTPARIFVASLASLVLLAFTLLLRSVGVRWTLTVALVAVASVSIFVTRTAMWFGAGVHNLMALAMALFAMAGFVRFHTTRRRLYLVLSCVALTLGLLTQERPLLALPAMVLLRYLVLPDPPLRIRQLPAAVWKERFTWLPYVVIAVVALGNQLTFYSYTGRKPSPGQTVDYLSRATFLHLIPGLAGFNVPTSPGFAFLAVTVAVCAMALAFVVWTVRTYQGAARIWWFLALLLLMHLGLVAWARVGLRGVTPMVYDLQYYIDPQFLVLLSVGLVLSRPRRELLTGSRDEPRSVILESKGFVVAGLLLIGIVSGWTARQVGQVYPPGAIDGRHYADAVRAGLQAQAHDPAPVEFLRMHVPTFVLPEFSDKPSLQSGYRALFNIDVANTPGAAQKQVLDETGATRAVQPHPIEVVDAATAWTAGRLMLSGAVNPHVDPATGRLCMSGSRSGTSMSIQLDQRRSETGLYFSFSYSADRPFDTTVGAFVGSVLSLNQYSVRFPASSDRLVIDALDPVPVDRFAMSGIPPESTTCFGTWTLFELVSPVPGSVPATRCERIGAQGTISPAATCGEPWDRLRAGHP